MDTNCQSHSILIVDDDATNLRMLTEILKPLYKVYAAPSGERALGFLENCIPDLIMLDVAMPVMSGYELIKKLKDEPRYSSIPVIFLTAQEGRDKEEDAFRLGAVDYIHKPISTGVVRARVNLHMELGSFRKNMEMMVEEKTSQLIKVQGAILEIMGNVAVCRDNGATGHTERVAVYSGLLVKRLAEKDDPEYPIDRESGECIIKASGLHDIGNVTIPDGILRKPGKLTPEEFGEVKKHTANGAKMIDDAVKSLGEFSRLMRVTHDIVMSHHEWWDGSGYPDGLSGHGIPLAARVTALADMYDMLTNDRPYKTALPHAEAVAIIREETGRHFDPRMISLLDDVFPLFADISEAR